MTQHLPPLKVGVAGVGVMGRNHARVLSDIRDFALTAVFDPDQATAEGIGFADVGELAAAIRIAEVADPLSVALGGAADVQHRAEAARRSGLLGGLVLVVAGPD